MKNAEKILGGLLFVISFVLVPFAGLSVERSKISKPAAFKIADSELSAEIKRQLLSNELSLFYPNSVKRFYQENNFNSPWIKPQSGTGNTWQAMLLIDCVLQFGLSHDDYHPHELAYDELHGILEKPGTIAIKKQARFDIMLTDAMLNLINNLHFGKLNPEYPVTKIDNLTTGFVSENVLTDALAGKDFMRSIGNVQPKSKEYVAMQNHMRLWAGMYTGDCYEIPESDIRRLAINMERLRWANVDSGSYMLVNIPAYTLTLYEPDSTYQFKAIVGSPENATPTLGSQINYFTTSSELRTPNNVTGTLVFRFPNTYNICLYDTREQQSFKKLDRDLGHSSIRVEHAEKLAALLLKYDASQQKITSLHKAILNHQTKKFTLQKPIPIKITYLTCLVKKGEVLTYKDIYNLDNGLEMAFYNQTQQFTVR